MKKRSAVAAWFACRPEQFRPGDGFDAEVGVAYLPPWSAPVLKGRALEEPAWSIARSSAVAAWFARVPCKVSGDIRLPWIDDTAAKKHPTRSGTESPLVFEPYEPLRSGFGSIACAFRLRR